MMDYQYFLGADPGKGGGIAIVCWDGTRIATASAWGTPSSDRDLMTILADNAAGTTLAVLERVHSSPQMGVASAFTFGAEYGRLRMALVASGIPLDLVEPKRWQTALGCMSKGDKNVTKARAQELFPHLKITHKTADALLLAEYARRRWLKGA
jgi:hypothetical protein